MKFKNPPLEFNFSADAIDWIWIDVLYWHDVLEDRLISPLNHLHAFHMYCECDALWTYLFNQKECFVRQLFDLGFFNVDYNRALELCWGDFDEDF